MKELSSRARALVDAALDSDAPSASDRARIQARLTAALGASAFTAVASQAAAMASAASSGGAASGSATMAAAASGAASGSATMAAAASGVAPVISASASGVAAAASGGAAVSGSSAAAITAGSMAAGSGATAAGSGWVAALGVKGAAWIGAAALSAAVGTTAVVTTHSHTELSAREVPAAARDAISSAHAPAARARVLPVGTGVVALGLEATVPAGTPDETAAISASGAMATADDSQAADRPREAATENIAVPPNAATATQPRSEHAARSGDAARPRSSSSQLRAKRLGVTKVEGPKIAMAAVTTAALTPDAPDLSSTGASLDPSNLNKASDTGPDARAADSAQRDEDVSPIQGANAALLPSSYAPSATAADAPRALTEAKLAVASVSSDATNHGLASSAPEPRASVATTQPRSAAAAAPPTAALRPSAASGATSVARALPPPAAAVTNRVPVPRVPPSAARGRAVGAAQPGAALSGELELLARAQRALHAGKLSLALTLLDQHNSQHAQGSLREERLAARAVVLCRMHQLAAGLVEAQRLAAQTPRSPLLPWVRDNCKR